MIVLDLHTSITCDITWGLKEEPGRSVTSQPLFLKVENWKYNELRWGFRRRRARLDIIDADDCTFGGDEGVSDG